MEDINGSRPNAAPKPKSAPTVLSGSWPFW